MSADYSRPNGFARWGWLFATLPVLSGAPNLALIVIDPQWWRFLLAGITILVAAVGAVKAVRLLMDEIDDVTSNWVGLS